MRTSPTDSILQRLLQAMCFSQYSPLRKQSLLSTMLLLFRPQKNDGYISFLTVLKVNYLQGCGKDGNI